MQGDVTLPLLQDPYHRVERVFGETLPDQPPFIIMDQEPFDIAGVAQRQLELWADLGEADADASNKFDYVLHALDIQTILLFNGQKNEWQATDARNFQSTSDHSHIFIQGDVYTAAILVPRSFYVAPYFVPVHKDGFASNIYLHDVLGHALEEATRRAQSAARFRLSGTAVQRDAQLDADVLRAVPRATRRKAVALFLSRAAVMMALGNSSAQVFIPHAKATEDEAAAMWDAAGGGGGGGGGLQSASAVPSALTHLFLRPVQMLPHYLRTLEKKRRLRHKLATRAPSLRTFRFEYDAVDEVATRLSREDDELARVLKSQVLSHGRDADVDLTPYDASSYRGGSGVKFFSVSREANQCPAFAAAVYTVYLGFDTAPVDLMPLYYTAKRLLIAAAYLEQTLNAQQASADVETTKRNISRALKDRGARIAAYEQDRKLSKEQSRLFEVQLGVSKMLRQTVSGGNRGLICYLHEQTFWHRVATVTEVAARRVVVAPRKMRSRGRLSCATPYDLCESLQRARGLNRPHRLYMAGFSLRRMDASLPQKDYPFAQRPAWEAVAHPGRLRQFGADMSKPTDPLPNVALETREELPNRWHIMRAAWLGSRMVGNTSTATLAMSPLTDLFQQTPRRFHAVFGLALDTLLFPELTQGRRDEGWREKIKFVHKDKNVKGPNMLLRLQQSKKAELDSSYNVAQANAYPKKAECERTVSITNPSWPRAETFAGGHRFLERRDQETACYDVFVGRSTSQNNRYMGYGVSESGDLAFNVPIYYWLGDADAYFRASAPLSKACFEPSSAELGQQHLLADYFLACLADGGQQRVALNLKEWETVTLRRAMITNAFSLVPLIDSYYTWRGRKHLELTGADERPFSVYAELASFYTKIAACGDRRFPNALNLVSCDVFALAAAMHVPHGLRPLAIDMHDHGPLERILDWHERLAVRAYVEGPSDEAPVLYLASSQGAQDDAVQSTLEEDGIVPQSMDTSERGERMRDAQAEDLRSGVLGTRHFLADQVLRLSPPPKEELRVPVVLGAYLQSLSWPLPEQLQLVPPSTIPVVSQMQTAPFDLFGEHEYDDDDDFASFAPQEEEKEGLEEEQRPSKRPRLEPDSDFQDDFPLSLPDQLTQEALDGILDFSQDPFFS